MKTKKVKEKIVKKEALPKKFCFLCGKDTGDYIIYLNGAVCNGCQKGTQFKEIKDRAIIK